MKIRIPVLFKIAVIILSIIGVVCFTHTHRAIASEHLQAPIEPNSKWAAMQLTPEEKAWLEQGHTVRARIGNFPPYAYWEQGPKGIAVDTIKLIAENIGFEVQFVKKPFQWKKALELIKAHQEFDMIPVIINTPERRKFLKFTNDYIFGTGAIFTRDDGDFVGRIEDLNGKTVAVAKGFAIHRILKETYPGIKLFLVSDDADALKAVATSRAHAYIGNIAVSTYLIQKHRLSNLKVAAPATFKKYINAMGIRDDWPELASIMNKGLDAISTEESNRILQRHLSMRYEYGISWKKVWLWVGVAALFLGLVLGVTLLWNRSLQKEILKRQAVEEALRRSKEEAEAANQAKSAFIANMSHEFRTPMHAVLGFTELLEATVKDPRQKSYLRSIKAGSKSLLTIINDVLDLSKIEAGKLKIRYAPMDAFSLFSEIEHIFSLKIAQKNLNYSTVIDPETPPTLMLDEVRLRQILINLVGNAIKFTEQGFIKLSMRPLRQDVEKGVLDLIITVEDSGVGIPETDRKRIFESFEQSKGHDGRLFGGTGLGLPICHPLVELMNGALELESELQKGSLFKITLHDVAIAEPEMLVDEKPQYSDIIFNECTLLAVDDVEHNLNLIKEYFAATKVAVIGAANGEEAVRLARERRPDLIIMDLGMPVMDGYEATRIIKADSDLQTIPVIVVSASSLQDVNGQKENYGFDGYLCKPISRASLFEELSRFLKFSTEEKTETPPLDEIRIQTVSPETRAQLPDIIATLEQEYMARWKTFERIQPIKEVEKFGADIHALGEQSQFDILKRFGADLINSTRSFDIKRMKDRLASFPELIQALKLLLNQ